MEMKIILSKKEKKTEVTIMICTPFTGLSSLGGTYHCFPVCNIILILFRLTVMSLHEEKQPFRLLHILYYFYFFIILYISVFLLTGRLFLRNISVADTAQTSR